MQKTLLKKSMNLFLCGILSTAVLLGGCGIGNTANTQKEEQPAAAVQQEVKLSGARNTPVVVAAQKVGPAVVGITNKAYVRDFFNRVQLTERGTGSGVIYDKSGLIATNNHVVEGAQEIIVSLTDGRSVKGRVLGADAATDLAVVKIDVDEDLPVAKFGDSSTLQVGEPAIAIGNPLGLEFRGSVTVGVISALNRSIELGDRKFNLIQTDAAINPGNSGGALVNADGEVVGINSAKPILDELAQHGRIARPYIGASLIDKDISARYGFDLDLHGGIFVMKIVTGGPVYNAGMRPGDIILTFDGAKVETVPELRTKLAEKKVGDTVAIVVLRAGIERTLQVTLQEMPEGN